MPTPRCHYIRPHTLAFGALLVALATRPTHVIAAPIDPAEQLAEQLALLGQLTALLDDFVRARPVGDLPAFVIEAEAELERRTHALELAARHGDWPMRRLTGSSQRRADRAHATTHDFMGIPPYSTRGQGRF